MVTDMEQAMRNSGDSPEAQWKTKILMRSSKDAECDISRRLHEFEATNLRTRNGRGQMAIRKLRRDFARVHEQFSTAIKSYERRQHAEVSLLNADDEKTEEFFDRAMREREEEINDIHHSMKKVNASKATTRQGMEHFHEAVMGMCGPENDEEGPDFWTMQDFMQCATSCNTQIVEGGICSANSMDGE
jgi:hypothetical protein